MNFFRSAKRTLKRLIGWSQEIPPDTGYDLWASSYDEQTNNPIIYLDNIVFHELIDQINIQGKVVVDVGCGTGRHWERILAKGPRELIGYDVSKEMLTKLRTKYPNAKTYIPQGTTLPELKDGSCDLVVSNLVIGYVKNLENAFVEWDRILVTGGEILLTDIHPVALERGATRSFTYNDRVVLIKNYIHRFSEIEAITKKLHWDEIKFVERKIDNSIIHFYQTHSSLQAFKKTFGMPILFGYCFRKTTSRSHPSCE